MRWFDASEMILEILPTYLVKRVLPTSAGLKSAVLIT